jgi:hypothetical protein
MILPQPRRQQRYMMSTRSSSGNKRFDLQALAFSISPEEALETFRKWAEVDQGLKYLINYNSIRIGAAYVPVWSFDVNVRFKGAQSSSKWKPPMFSVYDEGPRGKQDIIFVPNLAAYAGYSYRRSLINPVHSTTLVFMGQQTQPFGGWMLKDMKLRASGNPVSVVPDAWNSTQGRAFSVIKEELQAMADASWPHADAPPPRVQTQVVNARRVFMPTFVIDYQILGLEYRAFVSGCDRSAPVGGLSHQLFGESNFVTSPDFHQTSRNFLSQVWSGGSQLLQRFSIPMLIAIFRPFFTVFWFILLRLWAAFPIAGAAGGLFAGFRKVLQPWMDNRRADAEWERQRQHEAQMKDDENDVKSKDDFDDVSGIAQAYFKLNKDQILRALSGDYDHGQGTFDWYSDWQGTHGNLLRASLWSSWPSLAIYVTLPVLPCNRHLRQFFLSHSPSILIKLGLNSNGRSSRHTSKHINNSSNINSSSSR